jgi:hypothetical protein
MSKIRVSPRQLRLPLISYYVTVVDRVDGTTVTVVNYDTWEALLREQRERILRVEHKGFRSGLVANLVLRVEDGEMRGEPPRFTKERQQLRSSAELLSCFKGQNQGGSGGVDIGENPARSEVSKAKSVILWIISKMLTSKFAIFRGSREFRG